MYVNLHREKTFDNLVGSPIVLGLGMACVLISSGDGVDPWWCTGYRHGFLV